jgi:hypothetical protein
MGQVKGVKEKKKQKRDEKGKKAWTNQHPPKKH